MKFVIITHVNHGCFDGKYFAYAPYVKEMNIWLKHVDEVVIVAPLTLTIKSNIEIDYIHNKIHFKKVNQFNFLNFRSIFYSLIHFPKIIYTIFKAMKYADHIHLRCPGNMGLLACIIQIFFPKKSKTAKYAGNWDFKAKQPLTYRIQKRILSNTFLTKNMKVLVYGEWDNSNKNIKSFFTASYTENEKIEVQSKSLDSCINFMFAGALYEGKQPLYAIKLIEKINKVIGGKVRLFIYGEGVQKEFLTKYIDNKKLNDFISLVGNINHEDIKVQYQQNHFVILPSKSEGWPKVVAEGMFWKCLPIATKVSCVPNMLDYGNRGLLLTLDLEEDTKMIIDLINNEDEYKRKCDLAYYWSRKYTFDYFNEEIKKLLQ